MKRKVEFLVLGSVVLSGVLLAACNGASQQVDRTSTVKVAPQQQEVGEGVLEGNIEVTEEEITPTPMPSKSATGDVKPTPRLELSATDPSTVTLASGEPQVVEFFAFW